MPKSKRAKLERKTRLVEQVQRCVDLYERVFVFSFENMRTAAFKELRTEWGADSRFFLGKNKVMRIALGRTREDEFRENLFRVGNLLTGQVGLLFTNRPRKDVLEYLERYEVPEYARAGATASEAFTVPMGPLPDMLHTMAPQLRKLGLPVELRRGVIHVLKDYDVCEEGDTLSPEAAQLLKLFEKKTSVFRLIPLAVWERDSATFEVLDSDFEAYAMSRHASKGDLMDVPDESDDNDASDDEDEGMNA